MAIRFDSGKRPDAGSTKKIQILRRARVLTAIFIDVSKAIPRPSMSDQQPIEWISMDCGAVKSGPNARWPRKFAIAITQKITAKQPPIHDKIVASQCTLDSDLL